jgi:hypothetical protein
VGYQFGYVDYTSDDPIGIIDNGALPGVQDPLDEVVPGSIRSSQSHYFYVGGDYSVSSQLTASGKVGAQYIAFDDLTSGDGWTPYIDASAAYQYLPGSSLRGGVRYARNATDLANTGVIESEEDITTDQESVVLYAQVTHRITPRLTGNAIGTVQHSAFQGGDFDNDIDWMWLIGLSLDYKFSEHWSAEAGYNFDRLDSDVNDRSYSRNRVFLGVRATY